MGTLVFQANLGGAVNLIGPNTASTVNFTLPSADGTSGQALVTNGSGTLSFSTFTSGAAGSNTQVQFNSSGAFAGSANLTFDGTTLTSNALTVTNATTLSAGTANGVAYLNGSKVVTTGSALTYNGTGLGVGVASSLGILQVRTQTNANMLWQNSTFGSGGVLLNVINDAGSANATLDFQATSFQFAISGSEQMRLTSTGLGIGTSSPSQLLQARKDQAAYTWARIDNQTNSASAYAGLAIGANGNTWGITIGSSAANSNALSFVLDATGTNSEKMRLDSSGNLGLGVTPSTILDIGANNNTPKTISLRYSTVPTYLSSSYDGSVGLTTLSCNSYNTSNGSATWSAFSNTGYGNAALQLTAATTGSDIRFLTAAAANTNPTERARIDSSGNLLVGKTSSDATVSGCELSSTGGVFTRAGDALLVNRQGSDGTAITIRRSNTTVGTISVTTTATAYNTSSDYRLKNIDGPLTGSGSFIDALKPKVGTWKADGSKFVGFLAHEVQEVSPGSVVGEKDGEQMQAMEYGSAEFIANIIAELQSLRARVAQLEGN